MGSMCQQSQSRHPPRGIISHNHAEFAQSFLVSTLHQVKIRGFPGDIRPGLVGLNRVFQRLGLI